MVGHSNLTAQYLIASKVKILAVIYTLLPLMTRLHELLCQQFKQISLLETLIICPLFSTQRCFGERGTHTAKHGNQFQDPVHVVLHLRLEVMSGSFLSLGHVVDCDLRM